MIGPGKYDDLCTLVREKCGVTDGAVMLIVIGGNKGQGFSCQGSPLAAMILPEILETVARQMRDDLAKEIS